MAIESLFERYGARKHARLSGYDFDCGQCGSVTYRKPWEIEPLIQRWENPQKPSAARGKVFCSIDCKHGFHAAHRVQEPCLTCGAPVNRPPSLVKSAVYCTPECRNTHGLLTARCCWPGCEAEMPARRHASRKLGVIWKVDLSRSGDYARFPLCPSHLALVKQQLPERSRIQMGHTHWFKDPEKDLGTRGVTAPAAKLIIWAKTDGKCGHCGCGLSMSETPRRWQIDHVVPVFKGGRTNYANLVALCAPCHVVKSAPERAEASRNRARTPAGRGLTHPEKDAVIASLRKEVDALRADLLVIKGTAHANEEGQRRRVHREPKRVRPRQRRRAEGRQGSFEL